MSDFEKYSILFSIALKFASDIHNGQTRWAGEPYIEHPMRVAVSLNNIKYQIVGILHDVIEDGPSGTQDKLREFFPEEIVNAIIAISKQDKETYEDYITRVKNNNLARQVKIADINDNIKDLTEDKHQNRLEKYKWALEILKSEKKNNNKSEN